MADGLITQNIKNLIGGVSQQTPSLRRADQCEYQENCRNDPVTGMGKRYSSEFIADLTGLSNPEDYVFEYVFRDDYEQYIIALKHGEVRIFDKNTGYEYTAIKPQWALDYLANRGNKSPQRSYQVLNTIDTTFLLNKSVPVKYLKSGDDDSTPPTTISRVLTVSLAQHPKRAWNYGTIGVGDTWRRSWYEFTINGTVYTYSDNLATIDVIAKQVEAWIKIEYPTLTSVEAGSGGHIHITAPPNVDVVLTGIWKHNSRIKSTNVDYYRNPTTGFADSVSQGYMLVVNTKQATVPAPSPNTPGALWYIKQADYATSYTVTLDGTPFVLTTPEATSVRARAGLDTNGMAADMATLINADASYAAAVYGSVVYIVRADGNDFTIKANDDLGDRASYAIKEHTEKFEDLPPNSPVDFTVEIRGGPEVDVDPYHVIYKETTEDGKSTSGFWKETRKHGVDYKLDSKTMPIGLIRKQDASYEDAENTRGIYFELEAIDWGQREVGDDISAPMPSFCSELDENGHVLNARYIYSMSYYRNRLAFISDENIIFSEAGEFLNFFPTTVLSVLDGDVIDLALPLNGVEPVEWVLESSESLFLFAPKKQLRLIGGDVFNTESISIDVVSSYDTDMNVQPFAEGTYMYFWMKAASSSQLMEFVLDENTERGVATQITAHVPDFVKGQVVRTVTSSTERMMATVARERDGSLNNVVYIFNYLWSDGRRVQNAWQKWTFKGSIIEASIEQDILYLIIQYEDGTTSLEKITLSHDRLRDELGYPIYLDRREEVNALFVLPQDDERIVHSVQGRYFVGYPYTQLYVFSQFYPRNNEGLAIRGGRLQLKYLYLSFADTTTYKVVVRREGRADKEQEYTGRIIGSLNNNVGEVPVEAGQRQVRIQSRSEGAQVSIENDSVYDAVFQTADWEGHYVNRARRA